MKERWSIILIVLGIYFFIPSIILCKPINDSLIFNKVFSYKRNYTEPIKGEEYGIYLKYSFKTQRRNPTLFLIPTMYTIAKGERHYIGETYGKIVFNNIVNYEIKPQIAIGNISHYRKIMPVIFKYTIPQLYEMSLFNDKVLSPFNYNNRKFYKYIIDSISSQNTKILFEPRVNSTQLIKGFCHVNNSTGRIEYTSFTGEYDMIRFMTNIDMRTNNSYNLILPQYSNTKIYFKFLGNDIEASFDIFYDPQTNIFHSDSIKNTSNYILMNKVRPIPLTNTEDSIYNEYFNKKSNNDTINHDKKQTQASKIKEVAWDIIGDHILNSMKAETDNAYLRLSPIFNPLYLSYGHSRGLSYKMRINGHYNFSYNKQISFNPYFGYNFKIKKIYLTAPLRYTFNRKKNRWIEFVFATGNRITDSRVLDIIKNENRDTIDFSTLKLDYFNDNILKLSTNTNINKHISVLFGCIYHYRNAVNKDNMADLNKPTSYRSFAPNVSIQLNLNSKGPIITANYERCISKFLMSNMEYEKWEFDLSFKKKWQNLKQYTVRTGCGFYTNRSTSFFVDFSNFHENYLPNEDNDWIGQFQLLNSQWYNASKYYIRTNMSYESPLLFLTWLPWCGKYIENESIYISALQIEHTRPYFEVGYGITNRYFSLGIFGSLLNGGFYEIGYKFTFELFRNW